MPPLCADQAQTIRDYLLPQIEASRQQLADPSEVGQDLS
jgi:hypothetical protein